MKYVLFVLFLFIKIQASAQNVRVLDADTKATIPFFHLYDFEKSKILIGSEEGLISQKDIFKYFQDSLTISHVGYQKLTIPMPESADTLKEMELLLKPIYINLSEVEASTINELTVFKKFQIKLKKDFLQNSYMIRGHYLEALQLEKDFLEVFGVFAFGNGVNREGKKNRFRPSKFHLIPQYARRNFGSEGEAYSTQFYLAGIIINDLLMDIATVSPSKVKAVTSNSEGKDYKIIYEISHLNIQFSLSAEGNLSEIKWDSDLNLNLPTSDAIKTENGIINFLQVNDLLVPIAFKLNFLKVETNKSLSLFFRTSFIPSTYDFTEDYSEKSKLDNLFTSLTTAQTHMNISDTPFFFNTRYAMDKSREMENFSGIPITKADFTNRDYLLGVHYQNDNEKFKEYVLQTSIFREAFLDVLNEKGLTW